MKADTSDAMAQSEEAVFGLVGEHRRTNFIRLRTMIVLRWFAIAGQLSAILVATHVYGLQFETNLCVLTVGISVIGNLAARLVFPETKRLTERENLLMIVFDTLQLSTLLFLTGGLNNPFSLLILGPVTVSAAVLSLRSTVLLNALAAMMVTLMIFVHLPLAGADGTVLRLPTIFIFGQWIAILIALAFISAYARRITSEMNAMSDALSATQMALARAQKLSDLGGVVAAAAHELGTPLATIKLASAELMDELADRPDLYEDAGLIRDQADRCRDILQSMGRAGKDDLQLRNAPLPELLREAAEPHQDRGKDVRIRAEPAAEIAGETEAPLVLRRPEIIHGVRTLIQNAVDFARETVWIEAEWSAERIFVRIHDDGPGFPSHLLGRIGDPFVRLRRHERDRRSRPEYEGMGLGLFIAKTLLERTGAELTFANDSTEHLTKRGPPRRGAVVEVAWPRARIAVSESRARAALGENRRFDL